MSQSISYSVDADGICTLSIDQADKTMNVMSAELHEELAASVDRIADDRAVKGAILTSGKSSFLAGADLKEMDLGHDWSSQTKGEIAESLMSLTKVLRKLETCGKPVACAINGTALGAGFEMALSCHYRVAADDPKILLGLPEVSVGLMPGAGGTQRMIRLVGVQAALPLLLQGKMITPAEALKAGLVHKVVALAQLHTEAKRWLLEVGDGVQPWDKKGFAIPGGGNSLSGSFGGIFIGSNAMIRANGYGNYPAPELTSCAIFEGAQLPMDLALRIEAKYFVRLLLGSVSRNMIRTMFVNKGKADHLERRPAGVPKAAYKKIGVIGAGIMGGGLAYHAAKAGLEVILIDRDQVSAEKGKAYADRRLTKDIDKGKTTREKANAILARIHPTTSYETLSDVPLVVEAVFEDRQVKAEVFRKLEAVLPADAVLASNTSAMPITGLAELTERPERFIGLHFFSPVERMPLVEIIRGPATTDETLAKALDFVQALKKTPIVVNDSPGFFTSRFIGSFIGESLRMVNEGIKPALVENGARAVGMPMGALTISDEMGLDLAYHAGLQAAKDRGEANPDLGITGKMVDGHGRHGRKNGKGYYDYLENGEKRLWPGLAHLVPTLAKQPHIEEVKKRILYAQLVEGARCFAEGVLTGVIDGDLGATLGVGFPAYLGGPFSAMDTLGIATVVATCDELAARYSEQFRVPQLLRDMAERGQTFSGVNAVPIPVLRAA
jgi:3-hydroxyacyl-CoA dehydrogenase/enoyl-CoA hydratase/3-hydroxybutyryl-CoA epimerase